MYNLLCVALAIFALLLPTSITQEATDKWSPTADSSTFTPSQSVLEQWSAISREDNFSNEPVLLRTTANERDDKVMKKPAKNPDRIVNNPPNREVSETDLFLLGAIEKLAYRVDFLEKRMKQSEEMIYKIVAGTQETDGEPCPEGFTRQDGTCFHFSSKLLNWKSASAMCRGMGGTLMEMHSSNDLRKFVAFLQTGKDRQGNDYWTGGLNPGLLWLWGGSAKPVVTNGNQTDISGNGRCLLLSYQPPTRNYQYKGTDCASRYRYVCQIEDNTTERRLSRLLEAEN